MAKTSQPVALALYQPDIPQNLGAIMRLCACFGMGLHVIEPCGFPLDDNRIRRAGMDYIEHVNWQRHSSWEAFEAFIGAHKQRLVLLTAHGTDSYDRVHFEAGDILLFGRESAGVPQGVHQRADLRLTIPMEEGLRSLNIASSAAIVSGEVMRQMRLS